MLANNKKITENYNELYRKAVYIVQSSPASNTRTNESQAQRPASRPSGPSNNRPYRVVISRPSIRTRSAH